MEEQSKGKDLYWKPTKVPNLILLLFCWKPFKILFSWWSSNSVTKLPSIKTFTICCLNFYDDIFSHFTFQLYPTTCISCKNALFPSRPVYKLSFSLSLFLLTWNILFQAAIWKLSPPGKFSGLYNEIKWLPLYVLPAVLLHIVPFPLLDCEFPEVDILSYHCILSNDN